MLSVQRLRNNTEDLINRLSVRGFDASGLISDAIRSDEERRAGQKQIDDLQSRLKNISKEIGQAFQSGDAQKGNSLREETAELKETIKTIGDKLKEAENNLRNILLQIPNVPHQSVPPGKNETDNQLIRENKISVLAKSPVPHWEITEKKNIIDFTLGNKITGAGFPLYIGKGARLQRALISYFLKKAEEEGYLEYQTPLLVNEDTGYGTGQLPDKEGQMYHVTEDNLYLIPTAEVPLTNIYRDEIINEENLPIRITGYTPCFRREAGSYGKDVRGLNRLHQFDKVEVVQIVNPESSYDQLEKMVSYVESIIKELGLPYRIVKLCGGDLGFASAMTYDFEVFAAGQEKWLEVSSVSNFEDFQANRLKLRIKKDKKNIMAHTLNGSALALPRILASIVENYYDGENIIIPEVLVPFTGFEKI